MSTAGTIEDTTGRQGLRGLPALVWLLTAVQLLLLCLYGLLVPVYRAPDEPQHLDMVFAVRDGGGWPGPGDHRRMTAQIVRSYDHARFDLMGRREEPPLLHADATPRHQRPTFAEVADDELVGMANGMFQHPPGYYLAAAVWLTTVTAMVPGSEAWGFDAVIVAVRLLSVLLVAPLPLLAYLVAARLGAARRVAVTAAVVPLAVPTLTHIGSSVNSDNLLTLLTGVLTVLLAGVVGGDLRTRTAVGVGLVTGGALLTKGFALALPAAIVAAYAVAAIRLGARPARGPAGVALLIAAALGGWWWLRNLTVYGTIQPTGAYIPDSPPDFEPSLLEWAGTAATLLPQRFWGSFGWYQAFLPSPMWQIATVVVLVGAVVGVVVGSRRLRGGRLAAAVMLLPLSGILAIVLYGAYGYHIATGLTPALQGRYLYPGVAGLAAVTAVGWAAMAAERVRALPVVALLGAGGMQLVGVGVVLRRFYAPDDAGLADRLAAFAAWSAWPRPALALLAVTLAAAALAAGVAAVRLARRDPSRPVSRPPAAQRQPDGAPAVPAGHHPGDDRVAGHVQQPGAQRE